MLTRIRKSMDKGDEGFTLIELLVVIIIIGILASIAIPVFLSQRTKGYEAANKASLKDAATAEEAYLTDQSDYTADTTVAGVLHTVSGWNSTSGVTVTATIGTPAGTGYCLLAVNPKGGSNYIYSSTVGAPVKTATAVVPATGAATCK